MKVWITTYALTAGIIEHEAVEQITPDMLKLGPNEYAHGEGRNWHTSRAGAVVRAEKMRIAKLVSMRKRIADLEKLDFSRGWLEEQGAKKLPTVIRTERAMTTTELDDFALQIV